MGPHLGELAEPASETKQCLERHNGHRAARIRRRPESAKLEVGWGWTANTSRIWTREGRKQGVLECAVPTDVSGGKS